MLNLYTSFVTAARSGGDLSDGEKTAVIYHDIFDYPLAISDLVRWSAGTIPELALDGVSLSSKNGLFFVRGREGLVYKRLLRKRISAKKLEIAKAASKILVLLPSVKMVAVTGSLAMQNSTDEGDIDLMIVTKKGTLWITRLAVYLVLSIAGYGLRKPGDKNQKDKLCLNMWFDEDDLIWRNCNIYTAHEIAQVVPLVNKGHAYEKFLLKNKWIFKYWPNAVKIGNRKFNGKLKMKTGNFLQQTLESICYRVQYLHMKAKITRETVTPTRAVFHPQDWGEVVLDRLGFRL